MAERNIDTLAALRPGYLERLAGRRTVLTATIAAMTQGPQTSQEAGETHRLVHSMGSSAALYGYPALSDAARAAERAYDDSASGPGARLAALERLAREVRLVLEREGA